MDFVFSLMLGLSLAGGATCLVVFLASALLRKRLRGSWFFYLWLIVLLCFLVPVPLNLPFASSSLRDVSAALSSALIEQTPLTNAPVSSDPDIVTPHNASGETLVPPNESSLSAPIDPADRPDTEVSGAPASGAARSPLAVSVIRLLPLVWLTGAAAFLLWSAAGYALTLRRLKRDRCLIALDRVPIYESGCVTTPILAGLLRPAIYLPKAYEFSDMAVRHELCHLHRGDIWLKWLIQLTLCVHWFNPFAWLMKRELNNLIELCCDRSAVRRLGESDRHTYGIMLLDTASAVKDRSGVLIASMGKDKRILQDRLREIMKSGKASRKAITAMSVLAAVILVSAFVFGAVFSGCTSKNGTASQQASPGASSAQNASPDAIVSTPVSDESTAASADPTLLPNGGTSSIDLPSPSSGQIYLYGEAHAVNNILDKEFDLWNGYYHDKNMRHLFVELPYYTAEFLNMWMQADSDEILNQLYSDSVGTQAHNPDYIEFFKKIKGACPETIFHGTDVGHQYDTTGARYIKYLETQHLESSEQYQMAQENIEQGKQFYKKEDFAYRENKMVENFIRKFDSLAGESIMGIYGAAHTGLDAMDSTNAIPCMANQLQERYGDAICSEDLSKATEPTRVDTIKINQKNYEASYFGKEDTTAWSKEYVSCEYWRLENAYDDFKDSPKTGRVLPCGQYPMTVETGQVFVIDLTKTDGTVVREYFRSDGNDWKGLPTTEEFIP